jgi:hypothetical protein
MPKKTLCFVRNKREKYTIINPKNGQHREGQDSSAILKKNKVESFA